MALSVNNMQILIITSMEVIKNNGNAVLEVNSENFQWQFLVFYILNFHYFCVMPAY